MLLGNKYDLLNLNKKKKLILNLTTALHILFYQAVIAQELLKFNLKVKHEISSPISVSLDDLNYNLDKSSLLLYDTESSP